jgi:putative peptidoglycan lipid II flippase
MGSAALIAAITMASRVVGVGRWMAQSYGVGANATGTAYATANLLPNVLFEVVAGGALAGAVVPLLAGPLARGLRGDIDRISSALLTWAIAVLLPAALLLAVLAGPIVGLLYRPGSGTDQQDAAATVALASHLLVVFAPQVVLYGIGVVLSGVLQAQRRFAWPAAAPLASSAVVIVSYLVFRRVADGSQRSHPGELSGLAVSWLAWGTTAGVAAMSLPLLVPVLRSGVRLRPTLRFPVGVAVRARNLAAAGIGGLVAQQAAVLVTLALANGRGGDGAINVFQYAQAVYFLPYAVLAVPLATAVFPRLAEHAASGDRTRYAALVSTSTRAVLAASLVGAAVLVAVAPAVATFFGSIDASKDPSLLAHMGPTLTWLAPGLLGYSLIFQLSRVLFALERGRAAVTAVATGWLAVVLVSVLAVRLAAPNGGDPAGTLLGLAIGNTAGMTVAGGALLLAVKRASGHQALRGLMRTVVVSLAGAVVAAGAGRWSESRLTEAWGTGTGISLAVGIVAALIAAAAVVGALMVGDRSLVDNLRHSGGAAAVEPEERADHG